MLLIIIVINKYVQVTWDFSKTGFLFFRQYKAGYENPYWTSLLKSVLVELSSVIEQGFDFLTKKLIVIKITSVFG